MIKLADLIIENYFSKMSDDDQNNLASSYFNIGHDGEDGEEPDKHYCWMWNGNDVVYKKGGNHPCNFGHQASDATFKGWYDTTKNIISVVFPPYEIRKLGDKRPTEDDIPQYLYTKLISTFGKRRPNFVVFENLNESMFPKEFDRHSLGSCMVAAEMASKFLRSKGVKNFKIIEGFVSLFFEDDSENWAPHTWIEFDNGRKFDPTRKQWKKWGFDPDKVTYKRVVNTFTPEQYDKLCKIHKSDWRDFNKKT